MPECIAAESHRIASHRSCSQPGEARRGQLAQSTSPARSLFRYDRCRVHTYTRPERSVVRKQHATQRHDTTHRSALHAKFSHVPVRRFWRQWRRTSCSKSDTMCRDCRFHCGAGLALFRKPDVCAHTSIRPSTHLTSGDGTHNARAFVHNSFASRVT